MVDALIAIVSLLIGFYLGSKAYLPLIEQDAKQFVKVIAKKIAKKTDLAAGSIKRPSSQDLFYRNQDPIAKAGNEAMKETLDTIPELQKAKEELEEAKRKGLV